MEFLTDFFERLAGSEPLRPLLSAAGAAAAAAAGLYYCYYCSDERKRTHTAHTAHTPPPADPRASAAPPLDDRAFQDQDEEPAQHNEAGGQTEQSRLQLPSPLSDDDDDMLTKPLQEQNKMLENALYETMDREIDALVAIKDLLYLSSTVYKLQTKVDQLTAYNDECRLLHEEAEKERMESYEALVSGEAVMKLGMETALELYEKEKEANDTLKEKYKKVKESNTQLESEITEIKDQIHKMEQDEDADMKCDSAAGE